MSNYMSVSKQFYDSWVRQGKFKVIKEPVYYQVFSAIAFCEATSSKGAVMEHKVVIRDYYNEVIINQS